MTPFLYLAIKSLYWSKGGTLKKRYCGDDDSIKPYFIAAGENLTYTNLRRQISDSLEDKPFPSLPEELQKADLFRVRQHRRSFQIPSGGYESLPLRPLSVFGDTIICNIRFVIRGAFYAEMLASIAEHDGMPKLPFIRKGEITDMKYKIEKTPCRKRWSFRFTPGNYARNCTQTFFKMKRRYA